MKIVLLFFEYPTDYQHYLLAVIKRLRSDIGAKVLTIKPSEKADYSVKIDGFLDLVQKAKRKLGLSAHKDLPMKYAANFDIVHIQHSYLFGRAFRFPEGRKPKIVITLRGKDTYLKPWISDRWRDFYTNKAHLIDRFVVVSNHQKDYLNQKWNVPLKKIEVIPVSVTLNDHFPEKIAPNETIRILSAMRFTWEKNIKTSLKVIREIKRLGYNIKYTVCGDGDLLDMFYFFVDKYDLKEEVNFEGKVNPEKFESILKENEFFLQLSDSEALSASSLEAQFAGLPAIISNEGGLPETIVPGISGFTVEEDDFEDAAKKIIYLATNSEQYLEFSKNARSHVRKHFSIECELSKLKKLYQELSNNG